MAKEKDENETAEETPELDWGTAEVKDGTLTVALTTKPSKPWKGVFERTVKLLGGGDWESVALKADKVKVTGVQEGAEDSLKFFLEGAVQEADSALRSENEQADEPDGDKASGSEADEGDSRMTDRFRDAGA